MNGSRWTTTLLLLCGAQAMLLLAPRWVSAARAQEAPPAAEQEQPLRLLCRIFLLDLDSPPLLETTDRTTEVGQWVGEQQDAGWQLSGIDFEVGQKATGYPQGYAQVCMQGA